MSISGGKDSTLTLVLALERYRESSVPVIPVFCDTGWEHPLTYDYLDKLEEILGIRIIKIGREGGMRALIEKKKIFPSFRKRFCTWELKTKVFRNFLLELHEKTLFQKVEVWLGVRKDESPSRKNTEDFTLNPGIPHPKSGLKFPFPIKYLHPIKDLTEAEVRRELERRSIPLNSLYSMGFDRVGCYPCFLSSKSIVEVIKAGLKGDEFSKRRVEEIKELLGGKDRQLHLNYTLTQLVKRAERELRNEEARKRMLTLPFKRCR